MKVVLCSFLVLALGLAACSTTSPAAPSGQAENVPESFNEAIKKPAVRSAEVSAKAVIPNLAWNKSARSLLVSATYCCGMVSPQVQANYVPDVQVWGDGRIVWTESGAGGSRRVLQGQLTEAQLSTLLQGIAEAGFFSWQDTYTDPQSPMDMADKCIAVNLSAQSKKVCEYYKGAPLAFGELYTLLHKGAGAAGTDFKPERGYLVTYPLDNPNISPDIATWDARTQDLSLADAASGKWVTGKQLETLWATVNANPTSAMVTEGNQLYAFTLQIPALNMEP